MHSLQHKNNCLLQGTTTPKKLTTTIGKQKDKGNEYNQKGGIKLNKQNSKFKLLENQVHIRDNDHFI